MTRGEAFALLWLAQASACSRTPAQGLPATAADGAEGEPAAAAASPGLERAYALRIRPSKAISAVYRFSVRARGLVAREWVLFAPRPPDLPGQRIVAVRTSPASEVVRDLGPLGRPLLRARVHADSDGLRDGISLEVRVEAQLLSRRLVPRNGAMRAGDVEALTTEERGRALRATTHFDHGSPAVQAWLDANGLRRRAGEAEVDLARRVFRAIARGFRYEYRPDQNRAASSVCAAGWSDCGGMATLFVAALRSQGVAARVLVGRWAASARPGDRVGRDPYFQEHVKAEFHAPGVGWVPADLASGVLHDTSPEGLRYFGNDDGDFLTLHVDTDLEIDTVHFGRRAVTYLQRAAYWATGSGSFDSAVVRENWRVGPGDPSQ